MMWSPLQRRALVYASTGLGASLITPVFEFYYVKVYTQMFHVSEWWFQVAQLAFMVWNAVNDPLFGYIQDTKYFQWSWVRSRRHSILYGAPLFALSFVLFWFPWGDYANQQGGWLSGLQLMACLCFYDTMFTFVLLAQCALFTEMAANEEERLVFTRISRIAGMVGRVSVFFCDYISSHLDNFMLFQATCVVLGIWAWSLMHYTGKHARTIYDVPDSEVIVHDQDVTNKQESQTNTKDSAWKLYREIFTKDIIIFVLVNLLQIYHSTFLNNFTGIICDHLITKDGLSSFASSLFYGGLFISAKLLIIFGAAFVPQIGACNIVVYSFYLKIVLGVVFYIAGRSHIWIIILFFLIESGAVNSMFAIFTLQLSHIADNDMVQHQRRHPLSSMVFGGSALFTKPAVSLAPMLTVAILNRYGYQDINTTAIEPSNISHAESELKDMMFLISCATPVVVGVLQLILWGFVDKRTLSPIVKKSLDTQEAIQGP